MTIEEKLRALFDLQKVDSELDQIRILKGELPMEVSDLEDEIAGTQTRIKKLEADIKDLESQVNKSKVAIKDAENLIQRYEHQQSNVKNNREFDALAKEIEIQKLDIQLATKRIKETKVAIDAKHVTMEENKVLLAGKQKEVDTKREELKEIIDKTEKQEADLLKKSERASKGIEERILLAYNRVRMAYRNGLGVVTIERNACGGCFNQIPPQRQLEIRQRKKIIVCEHCGRIVVDDEIAMPTTNVEL